MKLSQFLVKAKVATYASQGEVNEKVLDDGAKELTFESSDLFYRDRYYGSGPFMGEEIVWQGDKRVWGMNYFGRIHSDNVPKEEIYNFLKSAMRLVEESRPFRGPVNFKEEKFEYVDRSDGDIRSFVGVERIFYDGEEVYRLDYHGGSI